jgi:GntR family transcriptional repressor for pyruvate dehydrogenase complex
MTLKFNKLTPGKFKGKGVIIAEHILERIKSGEYPSGSKLPAERIIAEQMGVSRQSVREAISALQIVGVLESRPGDGTYLADHPAIDKLSLQVKHLLEESDSPYEILQARKAVEIGIGRLVVEEATDEDIQVIVDVWRIRSEHGRKKNIEAYVKLGKKLHEAIAKATKNSIIQNMVGHILDVMDQPLWLNMRRLYYEKNAERLDKMIEIHDNIVNAIQARDAEKVAQALKADIDNVIEQLYNLNNVK